MIKFIETYQTDIIYAAIVIVVVVALYLLTRASGRWLTKKIKEQLPRASLKPINLIIRILTMLWFVLGLIALGFMFIDVAREAVFIRYFKLFSYLGVVSVGTIVAIMIINLWFQHKVKEVIAKQEDPTRSEERRVGKERRTKWSRYGE